jgi:hypothetical protein
VQLDRAYIHLVLMSEADLKNDLVQKMRKHLTGFVIFRHEDHRTSAIPDISVTGYRRTTWLEVKFADPSFDSPELQHLRMRQLEACGFGAWYVIYSLAASSRVRTVIRRRFHPKGSHTMSMESSERSATVGADIRPIVKSALAEVAKMRETSMSALVSEWLEEKLSQLGYNLEPKMEDGGEAALPLEGQ